MKRTLILIRHAKSSWQDGQLHDKERPLNERGERDCPVMAGFMSNREPKPDKIVSSPANRAHTTAKAYADAYGIDHRNILLEERIYEAPVSRLVEVINDFDDAWQHVLMFGHNPGFSYLVQYLGGQLIQLPTNGVVKLEMELDSWQHAGTNCGVIAYHDYPKNHPELQ